MAGEFITVDSKEFEKTMRWYTSIAPKRFLPAVARGYVNDIAFLAKKKSEIVLDRNFDYKNSRTRKFLEKGVNVKKARGGQNLSTIESSFGVLTGSWKTHRFKNREILSRQEKGWKLTQLKPGKDQRRTEHVLPVNKDKKILKFSGKLIRTAKGSSDPKQKMKVAIAMARRRKRKYVTTPFGIYKVSGGTITPVRYYVNRGKVKSKAKPWVMPSTNLAMKDHERVFIKNFNRQLKKFKFK